MFQGVVLDAHAANVLSQGVLLPENWTDAFLPPSGTGISRRKVGDIAYVLSDKARKDSRLVVVKLSNSGIFSKVSADHRRDAFHRLLRGALSVFEATISIPLKWKPYHAGNIVSFQASYLRSGETSRLCMEANAKKLGHCYFFLLTTDDKKALAEIKPDPAFLDEALKGYPLALKGEQETYQELSHEEYEFELSSQVHVDVTKRLTYKEWHELHLTTAQQGFVDSPKEGPLRVTGPAGTGKTLALVMRFLRLLYDAEKQGVERRMAFLTHSAAVSNLIYEYILNIDDTGALFESHFAQNCYIGTIHDMANKYLGYELSGIEPIALDGSEGRERQAEWLSLAIEHYRESDWPLRKNKCSEYIKNLVGSAEDTVERKAYLFDLMNEFACVINVLDARTIADKRKIYMRARRARWMMPLENEADRNAVFDMYEKYNRLMEENFAVGIDHMISDFIGFLTSFKWKNQIMSQGFDCVFIDEYHLFNRTERDLLPLLLRNIRHSEGPKVYLAYDPKQSPRDTFLGIGDHNQQPNIWRESGLGQVQNFLLKDVFRYTPEIQAFLTALDRSFPTAVFGDEWLPNTGVSELDSGETPIIREFPDRNSMIDAVVSEASRDANQKKKGAAVAVISLDYDTFETYKEAGKLAGAFFVAARDDLDRIQYAGKKFIMSMPEYVAGLQFDIVYLIDASRDVAAHYGHGEPAQRRLVSSIYLGASRARYKLYIFASQDQGGVAEPIKAVKRAGAAR